MLQYCMWHSVRTPTYKTPIFSARTFVNRNLTVKMGLFSYILTILALLSIVRADLKLVDNGYENLIIGIDDSVPENMCSSIFQGIEVRETFKQNLWVNKLSKSF